MADSILNYRPNITRTPPRVQGDVRINDPSDSEKVRQGREEEEYADIKEMLDDALRVDKKFEQLRNAIYDDLKNISITIDPEDYPLLSEAIEIVSQGSSNNTIDFPTLHRAFRILYNSFTAQYGFEPTQLLFAEPTQNGHMIPRVQLPDSMTCEDVANLSLNDIQDINSKQSIQSVMEKRARENQFSLLKQLWHMLLAFVLRWTAGLLRKTKLEKVPVVGNTVKDLIKKLDTLAARLEQWIRRGTGYGVSNSTFKSQNPEVADMLSGEALQPDSSATKCIQAAFQVVRHAITWASNISTMGTGAPESVNPQALLLWPYLEYQQNQHEIVKLNLKLSTDPNLFKEEKEKLDNNTRKIRYFANRYLNRTITDNGY